MASTRRQAEAEQDAEVQEHCTASEEEHFVHLNMALASFGIGGGCEGTYKGLLRMAKLLEKLHEYEKWECPDDDPIMLDTLTKVIAIKAEEDSIMGRGDDQ